MTVLARAEGTVTITISSPATEVVRGSGSAHVRMTGQSHDQCDD
jgi:hypothetical protein